MAEYKPISTAEELLLVNDDECLLGYRVGFVNGPAPTSAHSKSYWHGWRNGMVDGGHAEKDWYQAALAEAVAKGITIH